MQSTDGSPCRHDGAITRESCSQNLVLSHGFFILNHLGLLRRQSNTWAFEFLPGADHYRSSSRKC